MNIIIYAMYIVTHDCVVSDNRGWTVNIYSHMQRLIGRLSQKLLSQLTSCACGGPKREYSDIIFRAMDCNESYKLAKYAITQIAS